MVVEEVQEVEYDYELEVVELVEDDDGEEDGFVIMEQLDEEMQNLVVGLVLWYSDELIYVLQEMLKVLVIFKCGGRVLWQYVLVLLKCVEFLFVWEFGVGVFFVVLFMLVLVELFCYLWGKGE